MICLRAGANEVVMLLPATLVANQSAGISIMCWVVSRDTWHHPAHSPHPLITQRRHSHGHHHHPNVITSSPSLSPWMGVPSAQHIWHYTGGTFMQTYVNQTTIQNIICYNICFFICQHCPKLMCLLTQRMAGIIILTTKFIWNRQCIWNKVYITII